MLDANAPLSRVHAAIADLATAADRSGVAWTVPRAPGKWSPSQVVEHVARIIEESGNVAANASSKFPTIPFLLRPIVRLLVFKRILWRNAFLKMKAIDAFTPATGSATPAGGRVRLEDAFARFDHACRTRAASGQNIASTMFGAVPVGEFARFQELHVRHHILQMGGAA